MTATCALCWQMSTRCGPQVQLRCARHTVGALQWQLCEGTFLPFPPVQDGKSALISLAMPDHNYFLAKPDTQRMSETAFVQLLELCQQLGSQGGDSQLWYEVQLDKLWTHKDKVSRNHHRGSAAVITLKRLDNAQRKTWPCYAGRTHATDACLPARTL